MTRRFSARRALLGVFLLALPLSLLEAQVEHPAGEAPATAGAEAAAGEHGGHVEKDAGVYIGQTLWALGSFLVVLFVLLKKVLPPIVQAMDKRAAEIKSGLEAADKAREEAKQMMAQHEARLEEARREAAAIIEEGKADALRVKDSIVESARKESEEVAARSRREIELAKVAAIDELDRRSVELSLDIARHLIHKSLNAQEHQELIQERIRSLRSA